MILRLLLFIVVKGVHSWHATHQSLKHREGVLASSHVHMDVVCVVNVEGWERLLHVLTISR